MRLLRCLEGIAREDERREKMTAKYQVFVSSTYEDLKAEREQVIKATLEMGHIPVGMEMFSAADEEQWKIIARTIDQSDYYAVIVAHRYGSTVDGISYTEKEYDYAISKGTPVIGFVIDDHASWPAHFIERDDAMKAALNAFKTKMRRKPIGFWSGADDLHGKFSIALMKAITANPRPGWIRSTEGVNASVTTELTRLSSENALLRRQLEEYSNKREDEQKAEPQRLFQALSNNTRELKIRKTGGAEFVVDRLITLYDIFAILAPEMYIEKSVMAAARTIANSFATVRLQELTSPWPVPSNRIKDWLADLAALGLVEPSERSHSVTDTNEYWTLSSKGRELHRVLRKTALEAGVSASQAEAEASVGDGLKRESPLEGE
jgi:hypothetical protein